MNLLSVFVCLVGFLTSSSATRLYIDGSQDLTISRAATQETEQGDHDICLSRSLYTDTYPTSWELVTREGIKPMNASPAVAMSKIMSLSKRNRTDV